MLWCSLDASLIFKPPHIQSSTLCRYWLDVLSSELLVIMDDEVTQAVEKVIKEWEETSSSVENNVKAIEAFGTSVDGMTKEENSHQRLNGLAQDGLALLRSLQFRLDLLAQQLLTEEQVQSAQSTLKSWKDQYQSLHLGLRNANLQAQTNMRKAAQTKELLLGGGEESTIGAQFTISTMLSSVTAFPHGMYHFLRRTRMEIPFPAVERSENMLATFDESAGLLKKAESEYKGHRRFLMLILFGGCFMFSCAVFYVVSKRIGVFLLLRKVTEAIKAETIIPGDLGAGVAENGFNGVRIDDKGIPNVEVPPLGNLLACVSFSTLQFAHKCIPYLHILQFFLV
ncbi:hypothetical protein MKW92_041731 [Papaver armeniacum]|nr:hypothetical protein MKW92_041731 [Papaver armeniacum]